MAHDTLALRRSSSITLSKNRLIHFFHYASDDTAAQIMTAGYFNASRAALTAGSIIECVCEVNPAAYRIVLRVFAAPATGNVTVVIDSGLLGS